MSEPTTAPAPKLARGTVKIPGLGPVPKKWFLIVGGASVAVIGYVLWKRRGAAAPAAADGTGTGAGLEGQPCVDASGLPGVYDANGICVVADSAQGGYFAGSGAGGVSGQTPPVPGTGGFTTNGQWTQQAEADMSLTGGDPGTLAAALGAYITGKPLTPAQTSLVDQAIAFEGYPPVAGPDGYPPGIRTQPAPGQSPPPVTTPPGAKKWTYPAPKGLHAYAISDSGYRLAWNPVTGPQGQKPATYTVATYDSRGTLVDQFTPGSTSTAEYGRGGHGLTPGATYHTHVWANGAPLAPPHSAVSVTILRQAAKTK